MSSQLAKTIGKKINQNVFLWVKYSKCKNVYGKVI